MALNWWRKWLTRGHDLDGQSRRGAAGKRPAAFRLSLEALEDRTLLSSSPVTPLAALANVTPAVSGTPAHTITLTPSKVTVSSSTTTPLVGQQVSFTATVTDPGAVSKPTGQVEIFEDGSTFLKSLTLDATGKASLTTSFAHPGYHSLNAVYIGDGHFTPSLASLFEKVSLAPSNTELTSSVTSAVVGQQVTLTAEVTAALSATGKPTGTVTFKDGLTPLGAAVTLDSSGKATLSIRFAHPGSHSITAVYSGDSHFAASSQSITELVHIPVDLLHSQTQLFASSASAVVGHDVTLTAIVTVLPGAAGKPTGTVTFKDGDKVLGTGPVALDVHGMAILTVSFATAGSHLITASYSGNSLFASSAQSVTETIHQPVSLTPSKTSLSASTPTTLAGQEVTFTATVTAAPGKTGQPSGTVTFKDGSTVLKTVALNSAGKAVFSTSFAHPGSHSITAVYNGDSHFAGTSASVAEQVSVTGLATSAIKWATNATPAIIGQKFTLIVSVGAAPGATGHPTGTVDFKEGATLLARVPIDGNGHAMLTMALPVGNHNISAVYNGDSHFAPSTVADLIQPVTHAHSLTTVHSSANPATSGQQITLTAVVTDITLNGPRPTGTVTFKDGIKTLGTGKLDANGQATLSLTLPVGSHSISASYNGDANVEPITSDLLSLVVGLLHLGK